MFVIHDLSPWNRCPRIIYLAPTGKRQALLGEQIMANPKRATSSCTNQQFATCPWGSKLKVRRKACLLYFYQGYQVHHADVDGAVYYVVLRQSMQFEIVHSVGPFRHQRHPLMTLQ